jgi:hypothetical protein
MLWSSPASICTRHLEYLILQLFALSSRESLCLALKWNSVEQSSITRSTWEGPLYPAVSHSPSWRAHSYPELLSPYVGTEAAVIRSRSSGEVDHFRHCLLNSSNRPVRKFSRLNVLLFSAFRSVRIAVQQSWPCACHGALLANQKPSSSCVMTIQYTVVQIVVESSFVCSANTGQNVSIPQVYSWSNPSSYPSEMAEGTNLKERQTNALYERYRCSLLQTNSVAWVCERTIPTERLQLVYEVSANFCW